MSSADLESILARLRDEIDSLAPGEETARERLNALHAELVQRLDNPREDNQDQDFIDRIQEHIEQFEVEHPRATAILNDLMVTLGNMGI